MGVTQSHHWFEAYRNCCQNAISLLHMDKMDVSLKMQEDYGDWFPCTLHRLIQLTNGM